MSSRARDYQPGEHVPGTVYKVVRLIGAGGMGTVYDVEDTTIGKRYVLKTLHPQLGAREDLARRIQNEARTLARLNHPNIIEVFTAGVTGDDLKLPFYVMERLNGQSLRQVLEKRGQLDVPHACHLAIDLLDALDHAHDKGVIHRDVKPDNIFLHRTTSNFTVTKLLDFGIMSLLDAANRETAGRFLGTLRYAAPEQLRGDRPTPKMDVYAAGLVLYEAIAGRGPFDDEGDHHKVAAAHMNKPPPPVSRFAEVPRELDSLLMAALNKSPDARPRDAFSFASSLRNIKRALGAVRERESTENRATAVAVLPDSGAAPYVSVRQPSPDGPFVISPASPVSPASPASAVTPASALAAGGTQPQPHAPTGLPRTTLQGMSPPTLGPPLASPQDAAATSTTPEPVDRLAATNSLVLDAPRVASHGTESMPAQPLAATLPADPPPPTPAPPNAAPFQWPAERAPVRSEEPQVRTVSATPSSSRAGVPVVLAGVGMAGMMVLGAALLVYQHRAAARLAPPEPSAAHVAPVVTVAPLPTPQPVVTMPAPVLAPPALDVPAEVSKRSTPIATPTPTSTATATATSTSTSTPRPKPAPAPTPSAPHYAPDRPGPGF